MHRDSQESDQRVEERVQCGQTAGAALREGCLRNPSNCCWPGGRQAQIVWLFRIGRKPRFYVNYFDLLFTN